MSIKFRKHKKKERKKTVKADVAIISELGITVIKTEENAKDSCIAIGNTIFINKKKNSTDACKAISEALDIQK